MKVQLVEPPNISEETKKEMAKFFMRTSIPRILAEMAKKNGEKSENNHEQKAMC